MVNTDMIRHIGMNVIVIILPNDNRVNCFKNENKRQSLQAATTAKNQTLIVLAV